MPNSATRSEQRSAWLGLYFALLLRRPLRAVAIAYWWVTKRRVRARNRFQAAAAGVLPLYRIWIAIVEARETGELLAQQAVEPLRRITFTLWMNAADWTSQSSLDRTVASICGQMLGEWQLIVTAAVVPKIVVSNDPRIVYLPGTEANAANALGVALAAASGELFVPIAPDAILPAWALARYVEAARGYPDSGLFYGDEDTIARGGRRGDPWLKPQWNPELILAQDYVSNAVAIATPLARAAGPVPAELAECAAYALVLAASRQPGFTARKIFHVLCHMPEGGDSADQSARLRTVALHVAPHGASVRPGPFETVQVDWPLPDPAPSVSILIPTRDQVELLAACVEGLLRKTTYPDFDVVVIDNGSVEPTTLAWFERMVTDPRVSVLRYDHPYNYSAINNFAVAQTRGRFLCLLNNDTEVIDGRWLCALMRYAVRPEIGAVGAKLLYEDGSIQHAGVAIGLGNAAGHSHRALPDDQPGYFALAHSAHYASAVTAACLVVERVKFDAVNGLDAVDLQIAYNDVDFCLKLERAGWRNVYAPQAVLIHHESKSRGQDLSPKNVDRYMRELAVLQARWGTEVAVDPMHHPRLDRASETYRIRL